MCVRIVALSSSGLLTSKANLNVFWGDFYLCPQLGISVPKIFSKISGFFLIALFSGL